MIKNKEEGAKVMNKRKEEGFSLIEIMAVLLLITVLVGAVVYGIGAGKGSANLTKAVDQTVKIAAAAEMWKASNAATSYTGVSMAALASTMGTSATLAAPWGGVYTLAVNGANSAKFDISFTADVDVSQNVAKNISVTAVGTYVAATKLLTVTAP